jgi:hypothetical protein
MGLGLNSPPTAEDLETLSPHRRPSLIKHSGKRNTGGAMAKRKATGGREGKTEQDFTDALEYVADALENLQKALERRALKEMPHDATRH